MNEYNDAIESVKALKQKIINIEELNGIFKKQLEELDSMTKKVETILQLKNEIEVLEKEVKVHFEIQNQEIANVMIELVALVSKVDEYLKEVSKIEESAQHQFKLMSNEQNSLFNEMFHQQEAKVHSIIRKYSKLGLFVGIPAFVIILIMIFIF